MPKIYKNLIFIFLLFLGILITNKIVKADVVSFQTDYSYESSYNIDTQTNYPPNQFINISNDGQFKGISGTITSLVIKVNTTVAEGYYELQIREQTTKATSSPTITNTWYNTDATTTNKALIGTHDYSFDFTGVTLDPTKFYRFEIDGAYDNGYPHYKVLGTDEIFYPSPESECYSAFNFTCNGVKLAYFEVYGTVEYTINLSNEIYRYSPADGQRDIATNTFLNGFYVNDGSYDKLKFYFYLMNNKIVSSSTLYYVQTKDITTTPEGGTRYSDQLSLNAGKNYFYYATMENSSTGSSTLEYGGEGSMPWFFTTIQSNGSTTPFLPSGYQQYNENAPIEEYCVYESGNAIANAIKYVLCVMFIPNHVFWQDMGDKLDNVKTKAPIGYVTAVLDEYAILATTTAATSTPVGISQVQWNILLGLGKSPIFDFFKLLLRGLLYAIFLLYIFSRIKHLIKI